MKILLINDYNHILGGAEKIVYQIKEILEIKGHSVDTWTSKSQKKRDGIKSIFNLFYFLRMRKYLGGKKYDIIHIHHINSVLTHSILLALKGQNTILHVHDYSYLCPKMGVTKDYKFCPDYLKSFSLHKKCLSYGKSFFIKDLAKIIKLTINRCLIKKYISYFIFPSNDLSEKMSRSLHLKNDCTFVLPNFLIFKNESFKKKSENSQFNFLFVGRLSKEKGVEILIEAFTKLRKKNKEIKLTIVGDGPSRQTLEKIVKESNSEKSIIFSSWVKNGYLNKYYKEASCLVIPSIWPENSPTVLQDAVNFNKKTIVSDIGGAKEFIDYFNGAYTFEVGNSQDLSDKMEKVIKHRMKRTGLEPKKRISSSQFYENLINIYSTLLKERLY